MLRNIQISTWNEPDAVINIKAISQNENLRNEII